jgi:hypothetical protein
MFITGVYLLLGVFVDDGLTASQHKMIPVRMGWTDSEGVITQGVTEGKAVKHDKRVSAVWSSGNSVGRLIPLMTAFLYLFHL